jgi:hypothetical protein
VSGPFVRKNTLTVTCYAVAADGTNTQPSGVTVNLSYKNLSGVVSSSSFALTYVAPTQVTETDPITGNTFTKTIGNNWTGTFDTSVCGPGQVDWVAYASGAIQPAAQGTFLVQANKANVV